MFETNSWKREVPKVDHKPRVKFKMFVDCSLYRKTASRN